jgi:predicted kinase
LAETCISNGFSTIIDATFLQRSQRELFRSLAQRLNCDFHILDCQTETGVMRQRIQQRETTGTDASEANLAVLEKQLDKYQPLGSDERPDTLPINTTDQLDIATILKQLLS